MVKQSHLLSCLPISGKASKPTKPTDWEYQLQEKEVNGCEVDASPPLRRPVPFFNTAENQVIIRVPPLHHHHHNNQLHNDTMTTTSSHSSMSSSSSPCSSSCSRSLPRSSSENSLSVAMDTTAEVVTVATQTENDYEDFASVINQAYSNNFSSSCLDMLAQHNSFTNEFLPTMDNNHPSLQQHSCYDNCPQELDPDNGNYEEEEDEDEEQVDGLYDPPWDITQGNVMSMVYIEEKDVTLHRRSISDKLGLTLCYLDREDTTLVYVGEVDNTCVAGESGQIRPGDHILQINGVPVTSRPQAIGLFSNSQLTISLKIARYLLQVDDGFHDGSPSNTQEEDLLKHECGHDDCQCTLEEGHTSDTTSTNRSKQDSGFGTRTGESSEQECPDADSSTASPHTANSSFSSGEVTYDDAVTTTPPPPPRRVRKTSVHCQTCPPTLPCDIFPSNKLQHSNLSDCSNIAKLHSNNQVLPSNEVVSHKPPQAPNRRKESVGRKISFCDMQTVSEHIYEEPITPPPHPQLTSPNGNTPLTKPDTSRSPRLVPRMGTKLCSPQICKKCSSSKGTNNNVAAETSTSSLNAVCRHDEAGFNMSMLSLAVPQCSGTVVSDDGRSEVVGRESGVYGDYAGVMYTNEANLYHTIAIQQQLFKQKLENQGNTFKRLYHTEKSRVEKDSKKRETSQTAAEKPVYQNSCHQCGGNTAEKSATGVEMEWVVKRRADGSRYITRRPVRSKLLKERAKKLNEERCGLTTDDDAMSELKVGKYWSREDRKKHLEQARQHRINKQALAQQQKLIKESNQSNQQGNKHHHGEQATNQDVRHHHHGDRQHKHKHRHHNKDDTAQVLFPKTLLSVTTV